MRGLLVVMDIGSPGSGPRRSGQGTSTLRSDAPADRAERTRPGDARPGSGGRSCGQQHPVGTADPLPHGVAGEHTAGMTWLVHPRRRTRHELVSGALVLVGLVLFVGLVYAAVVLGVGALTGDSATPDLALSVLATAIVALAFDPVQTRLEDLAARVVHPDSPAPYDVLRRFFATVTGSYRAEELPGRMARVLAEGTGAAWSQVWLVVGERATLAATWPEPATRESVPPD